MKLGDQCFVTLDSLVVYQRVCPLSIGKREEKYTDMLISRYLFAVLPEHDYLPVGLDFSPVPDRFQLYLHPVSVRIDKLIAFAFRMRP